MGQQYNTTTLLLHFCHADALAYLTGCLEQFAEPCAHPAVFSGRWGLSR